jgi:hypothetical protein
MKSVTRGAAGVAVLAGFAVVTASAAWADPPTMNGTYNLLFTDATGGGFPLVFTPCGPGCSKASNPNDPNFGGQAHLANGQWKLDIPNDPTAIICHADQSTRPGTDHYLWDAVTLQGQFFVSAPSDQCPNPQPGPEVTAPAPFTLISLS